MQQYNDIYDACVKITKNKQLNTILDLGARHGEGYELFGKYHSTSEYIFVEPSRRCTQSINKVIKENPNANFKLINGVLGSNDSEIKFYQLENDYDQSGNLFSDRNGQYGNCFEYLVKVYDYRSIFNNSIDFVKCNIEGAEYQLIEDGFFDIVDCFVMEAHNAHIPNKNYKNIISALNDKFILNVWGNVNYKYCFINGQKR